MEKQRITYIDVAKGILILFVVYGHIYGHAKYLNFASVDWIRQSCNFFIPFYMPCFFVITGFCSSFKKPFLKFIWQSFKSIILPGITLSLMLIVMGLNASTIMDLAKEIILYGGQYWFLTSLFLARIIYWLISKYLKKSCLKTIACVLSFILGFVVSLIYNGREFWWFVHSLLLLPYLGFGQLLKNYELRYIKMYSLVYGITFILTALLSHYGILRIDFYYHEPGISQDLLNVNLSMLVSLIVLSLFGSLFVLGISKVINSSGILEYLGKNSLVIYCVHGAILGVVLHKIDEFLLSIDSEFSCVLSILIAYIITVVFSCTIAFVLNKKYLKALIGKF